MSEPKDPLNLVVSRVLTGGLLVSIGAMAAGLLLSLKTGSVPTATLPPSQIAGGLAALDPAAYASAGIAALLATPAVRVLVLLGGYLKRRDWPFAGVAAVVLGILSFSLLFR